MSSGSRSRNFVSTSPLWKRGFCMTRARNGMVVVGLSMIAKVICQGRDRPEALAKMQLALETFIIEGPTTTIPFLARVMQNPRFQSGDVDTKFLEREPELMREPA